MSKEIIIATENINNNGKSIKYLPLLLFL